MRNNGFFHRLGKWLRRTDKKKLGDKGEALVAKYLEKNGYLILERNYTCGRNEIDIIAIKDSTVHFVEVKSTASDRAEEFKMPSEAVDDAKQKRLISCAKGYITHCRNYSIYLNETGYSFDVAEVYFNRKTPEINYMEGAFLAGEQRIHKKKTNSKRIYYYD